MFDKPIIEANSSPWDLKYMLEEIYFSWRDEYRNIF